jgi:ComF family protein
MLKYDGKRLLARPMAEAMAFPLRTRNALQGCEVIVPVALHPRRLRQRGYNQSLWLAGELSSITGLPVSETLRRTRDTHTQVGLHAAEREKNMEGAFAAEPGLAGRHVLLIDDVTTTGATARDAARALLASGVASVRFLAFARDIRL